MRKRNKLAALALVFAILANIYNVPYIKASSQEEGNPPVITNPAETDRVSANSTDLGKSSTNLTETSTSSVNPAETGEASKNQIQTEGLLVNSTDTQAPTAPTELKCTSKTDSTIQLSWMASTDDVGITEYEVYRDGVKVSSVPANEYTDTVLTPGAIYTYTVKADDAAGNVSDDSNAISVKTLLIKFSGIACGSYSTLQVKSDGTLWTCGDSKSYLSVKVEGLSDVAAAEGGNFFSAALKSDGSVWTWGYIYHGEAVDWTTYNTNAFQKVEGLSEITSVTAGSSHAAALKDDGTVWTWGANRYGQLGDGTTVDRYPPVKVEGLTQIIANSTGQYHTAALKSDGTVWTWGSNWYGQLGDGTSEQRNLPVQVEGLKGIVAISAGQYHTVALKNDGTVWAWGDNACGELGDGTDTSRRTPVQVKELTGIIAIAAGYQYTIALKRDGSVWAWGYNGSGQLGSGSSSREYLPIPVKSITDVTAIAAGYSHTAALKKDGSLWTWGENYNGQLGDGTRYERHEPVLVLEDAQVPEVPHDIRIVPGKEGISLSWAASTDNVGTAGYEVYRDGVKIAIVADTVYEDKSVETGGGYSYTLKAFDKSGNISGFSRPVVSDWQQPSMPENLSVASNTASSVTLMWTAAIDNTGVEGYEIFRNGVKIGTTSATYYTDHLLVQNTTYTYTVKAFDTGLNISAESNPVNVTTDVDTQAPTVPMGLNMNLRAETRAVLSWDASSDNEEVSVYDIYIDGVKIGSTSNCNFNCDIPKPYKTSIYTVRALDSSGNISDPSSPLIIDDKQGIATDSAIQMEVGDTEVGSIDYPGDVDFFSFTVEQSGKYAVECTNSEPTYVYLYDSNGKELGGGYNSKIKTELLKNQIYYIKVDYFKDSVTGTYAVKVRVQDAVPPSAPLNLKVTYKTASTVTLSWTPSTDNKYVKGYLVYRNNVCYGPTESESYTDSYLSPNTTYSYTVEAFDEDNNISEKSDIIVTTPYNSGAPKVPDGLSMALYGGAKAYLEWNEPSFNAGVKGYEVYLDGTKISTSEANSYECQVPEPGKSYVYTIRAFDEIGNISDQSSPLIIRDDYGNTIDLAAELKAGNETSARIDYLNDLDYLKFTPTCNGEYIIECTGSLDTYGNLYDSKGNQLDYDDQSGKNNNFLIRRNLTSGETYYIKVRCFGYLRTGTYGIRVALSDKENPTAPTELAVKTKTSSSFTLEWAAGTDNVGVAAYDVYRDGIKIASVNGTVYTDSSIRPDKAYTYYIKSVDAAGNISSESNSVSAIFETDILSDIVVDSVEVPYEAYLGQPLEIKWNLKNIGNADAKLNSGSYSEQIYISQSSAFDENNAVKIYDVNDSSIKFIKMGQSIQRTLSVNLPRKGKGEYYIYIKTDNSDKVYEINEKNNTGVSNQFNILDKRPDLIIGSVSTPKSVVPGRTVNINWEVKNTGDNDTAYLNWVDEVYISKYPVLDKKNATLLGDNTNIINVTPGGSYKGELVVSLPDNIAKGKYYIFVQADCYDSVYEKSETNNVSNLTLVQVIDKAADLIVQSVSAPQKASSGKVIQTSWIVKNNGDLDTENISWIDSVYLSPSVYFDKNSSTLLGSFTNKSYLLPGQSYKNEAEFTLPDGIGGSYYLHIVTDYSSCLSEKDKSNNIGTSSVFNVTLSPSPDLKVGSVSSSTMGFSGTNIEVDWTVENSGAVNISDGNWSDYIYLSDSTTFSKSKATLIGRYYHNGKLDIGEKYSEIANVCLPNAIYGKYYIFVVTDGGNNIFEHIREDNNVSESSAVEVTLKPPADLEITKVTVTETAKSGSVIDVGWEVKNIGLGVTLEQYWEDRVYISKTPEMTGGAVTIGIIGHWGDLEPDGSYSGSGNFILPRGLSGNWYVIVVTNYNKRVYEFNSYDNNTEKSGVINVEVAPAGSNVDIAVISAKGPVEAKSGRTISVSWEVKNIGGDPVSDYSWTDTVYLSPKKTITNGEYIQLGKYPINKVIKPGEGYSLSVDVPIPNGISGSYYVIFAADAFGNVNEISRYNNWYCIPTPINITLSPTPDLMPSEVTYTEEAASSKKLDVTWKVTNNGNGDAAGYWYDTLYLSKDAAFDNSDKELGKSIINKVIGPGENYGSALSVKLPDGISGVYYFILKLDRYNHLYEYNGEDNNIKIKKFIIKSTPPCDLVVHDIKIPGTAVPGEKITVNWKIENAGTSEAKGDICDSVYISADPIWDVDDIHFGDLNYTVDLYPSSDKTNQLSAEMPDLSALKNLSLSSDMPGVEPGSYYVIVKTNVLNRVYESDIANNTGVSADTLKTDVESLSMGSYVIFTADNNSIKYYKVSTDGGKDILIKLESTSGSTLNGLYADFGKVPNRGSFDYCSDSSDKTSKEILIPEAKKGDYYIAVYLSASSGTQTCTLGAITLDFGLRSIGVTKGGQGGQVTVRLDGSLFSSDMTAELTSDSICCTASTVYWFDSCTAYATFDLKDIPLGEYTIRIKDGDNTAALDKAFTVVKEIPGSAKVYINYSASLRPGQNGTLTVNYYNVGNTDISIPIIHVQSLNVQLRMPDESSYKGNERYVAGMNREGPGGILPPGGWGRVILTFRPTILEGTAYFTAVPVNANDDLLYLKGFNYNSIRPSSVSEYEWNGIWNTFTAPYTDSDTARELTKALSQAATRISLKGMYTNNFGELINLYVKELHNKTQDTQGGIN